MESQKKVAEFNLAFQICFYYLLVYLLAILTFFKLKALNIVIETIAPPNSAWNSIYLLVSILVATVVLILIIKYAKRIPIFKILELLVIFTTLSLFISLFVGDLIAIALTIILIILKEVTKNFILRNMMITIMVGFIGGYIAYSLGTLPIVLLIVLVGIYDYIAVFKTKHMVYLAENIVDKNTVFTYELRTSSKPLQQVNPEADLTKKSLGAGKGIKPKFDLGTGDFALPLIAITEFTIQNYLLGILCFVFTVLALVFTIFYLLHNKEKKALPALPLQAMVILIFYLISLFI